MVLETRRKVVYYIKTLKRIPRSVKKRVSVIKSDWKFIPKKLLNVKCIKKKDNYSRKSSHIMINCDMEDRNSIKTEEIGIQYAKANKLI